MDLFNLFKIMERLGYAYKNNSDDYLIKLKYNSFEDDIINKIDNKIKIQKIMTIMTSRQKIVAKHILTGNLKKFRYSKKLLKNIFNNFN